MIAAISPADINYDETLSTLRYADRAKQIRVHAKINQNQTGKIIQQLREENERLKRLMASTSLPPTMKSSAHEEVDVELLRKKWEEETKAAMIENERMMREMKESYEEKLQSQMNRSLTSTNTSGSWDSLQELKQSNPYLSNLNFDELLSGKIVHIINGGTNTVGKSDSCNIILYGPKIQDHHATIYRRDNGLVLLQPEGEDCRLLLNGDQVTDKVSLNHHDRYDRNDCLICLCYFQDNKKTNSVLHFISASNERLMFGTTQLFVFHHPDQSTKVPGTYAEVTFELAQEEIQSKAGYHVDYEEQTLEQAIQNKDMFEVLPAISEANGISEELDRNTRFEAMLIAPQILGKTSNLTEVNITKCLFLLLLFMIDWHFVLWSSFLVHLSFDEDLRQSRKCRDRNWTSVVEGKVLESSLPHEGNVSELRTTWGLGSSSWKRSLLRRSFNRVLHWQCSAFSSGKTSSWNVSIAIIGQNCFVYFVVWAATSLPYRGEGATWTQKPPQHGCRCH